MLIKKIREFFFFFFVILTPNFIGLIFRRCLRQPKVMIRNVM